MTVVLRTALVTWRTAWAEASANRAGFWTQIVVMMLNNAMWILFWFLLFDQVQEIRGWDFSRVVLLWAVLTTSAGVCLGLLNNVRRIGELIETGGLDAALALPAPTLAHLLTRRIEPIFLGDLVFGVLMFLLLGESTPLRALIFVGAVVCSVLVLGGFLVLAGSVGFFVQRAEPGELGFHSLLLFSSYPIDLFAGGLRVVLYGVVPAAFVSSVPASLISEFSWPWAFTLAAVSLAMATSAVVLFNLGLRHYSSGATWTQA